MASTTTTRTRKTAATRSKTPAEAHPLSELIEPASVHEAYVPRLFDGYEDLDLLEYADKANMNVLLFGPTGPGKTHAVRAYAARGPEDAKGARHPKPLVTVACNGGLDPATFFCRPTRDSNGAIQMLEATTLGVIRNGGVLYLDEVNFLHPRIAAVLHGLLDDRRAVVIPELGNELVKAHPDLFVVAAYNPDYQGTRPLNEAFKNRFKIKLNFDYDRTIEEKVVPPFDGVDVTPLLDLAAKLRQQSADGTLTTPVSTNMLSEFMLIGIDTSYQFALRNFLNSFHQDERQAVENNFELVSDDLKAMLEAAVDLADES